MFAKVNCHETYYHSFILIGLQPDENKTVIDLVMIINIIKINIFIDGKV